MDLLGTVSKKGRMAVPPLARDALTRYLTQRGLPTTPGLWTSNTPIVGMLKEGRRARHFGGTPAACTRSLPLDGVNLD